MSGSISTLDRATRNGQVLRPPCGGLRTASGEGLWRLLPGLRLRRCHEAVRMCCEAGEVPHVETETTAEGQKTLLDANRG